VILFIGSKYIIIISAGVRETLSDWSLDSVDDDEGVRECARWWEPLSLAAQRWRELIIVGALGCWVQSWQLMHQKKLTDGHSK
jgi:hypothetical protein